MEGRALRHCVSTYRYRCKQGLASIWSVRQQLEQGASKSILTCEIDPHRRTIVQIRGYCNGRAKGKPLRLLMEWAAREGLLIQPRILL